MVRRRKFYFCGPVLCWWDMLVFGSSYDTGPQTIHSFSETSLKNVHFTIKYRYSLLPLAFQGLLGGSPQLVSFLVTHIYKPFRLFGRGTTGSLGDLRSPWLSTTYKPWDDPPSELSQVLTPYLDRSLLETIYRSVGQSLGEAVKIWGTGRSMRKWTLNLFGTVRIYTILDINPIYHGTRFEYDFVPWVSMFWWGWLKNWDIFVDL